MAREVDRLLAQLSGIGRHGAEPGTRSGPQRRITRVSSPTSAVSRGDRVGLWARVGLGAVLGGLMTQWPYPHACGGPLAGYLGAVSMVVLAGIWIAVVSWKLRSAAAHVLAFLLLFWGIVLAAERVLPRVGYAAERATWQCLPDPSLPPR
jgi:hypothetical protein